MTIDEIRELVRLVTETDVTELEVQRGEDRVLIRRVGAEAVKVSEAPTPVAVPAAAPSAPEPKAPTPPSGPELTYVKSPIVGTFYESPSPADPPFVRIGESVAPGKVLCIIESMKLMNEIEAEVAGVIETKLVENGQPVEYGEALFGIRPV